MRLCAEIRYTPMAIKGIIIPVFLSQNHTMLVPRESQPKCHSKNLPASLALPDTDQINCGTAMTDTPIPNAIHSRHFSGFKKSKNVVFDAYAAAVAEKIKLRTAPTALFLNAPTYNSAVVLSGRQSLIRYPGHLSSHGIDYTERENDVKKIYSGVPAAVELLQKYGIEYVLISPEERNTFRANEEFFKQYSLIAEDGQYKVYKVQK
jgi:hypothetical protein